MDEFPTTRPRILGVTGGIGAGKSTVCRALAALGVPVWSADEAGRAVYRQDAALRCWVAEQWGDGMLLRDGAGNAVDIDRTALGQIVFQSPEALALLSAQIHPRVAAAFASWLQQQSCREAPPQWVAREAAILFESGTDGDCDATVTVEAPVDARAERVRRRDGANNEAIRDRMARQWSAEQRMARADFVLHNGPNDRLIPQICALCEKLMGDINCSST